MKIRPFAALLSLFVAGCASVPTSLPPEAVAKLERTQVRCFIPQHGAIIDYMPSTYGAGFGLAGALADVAVNSSLASSAKTRAKRLQETVSDVDFPSAYGTSVSNVTFGIPWLKAQQFDQLGTNFVRLRAPEVADRSALILQTRYSISPDIRVFSVATELSLFFTAHHKKPSAAVSLLSSSAEIGSLDGDKALTLWTTNNGAAYRRAVEEGVRENDTLLRLALSLMNGVTNTTHRPMSIRARLEHGRAEFGIPTGRVPLHGAVIEETDSRIVFLTRTGRLYSLPKSDVELNSNEKAPGPAESGARKGQLN